MKPKSAAVLRSFAVAALLLPAAAFADTFNWTFASPNVSGSGSLTAVAYGNPGEFLITGGSGTVMDTTYGTLSVVLPACATPDTTCTLVNTDHAGANLSYDDLLFPGNGPGGELDGNGIVLTPGPGGTDAIGIWDGPSQEFYSYAGHGYQDLTTPFTVTAVPDAAPTPEPSSLALLGTGLIAACAACRRKLA